MKTIYNKILSILSASALFLGSVACDNYLDVVPNDGIPTVDMAFNLRSTAIRYLATCYAYMPLDGAPAGDCAFLTGDELWDLVGRVVSNTAARVPNTYFQIARGYQSASNDMRMTGLRCTKVSAAAISFVIISTECRI